MINIKRPITEREQVVSSLKKGEIGTHEAANLLGCTKRTVSTYLKNYLVYGKAGLVDHRRSNNHKLSQNQISSVVNLKTTNPWRSARNIRDHLSLPVRSKTVLKILKDNGLTRQNIKRVKPIIRFEANGPNDMWQTDIMGKITFPNPNVGTLYLIATLDDYSRFVPHGNWYKTQGKINVFNVWYESLSRWGVPNKMLQDEGSQYKARTRFGVTDYQWYAKLIGTKLIWAKSAQCKGKIERFWKFVQKDFVPLVWHEKDVDKVRGAFRRWLAWYNYKFKSKYFDKATRAARYGQSKRRLKRVELETLLAIEERRKVTRESTISLYGKHYTVPPGYIGCRIWVKIKGNKVFMEANNKVIWRSRLRL